MKIGIAGVGGIGSNVARLLAQSGVEMIKIVDFDLVEASNLNRQFYTLSQVGQPKTTSLKTNLELILPEIKVEIVEKEINFGDSIEIFKDCPVVVEGFDNKILKKMIIEELAFKGTKIVSASGIAGPDLTGVKIKKMGNCHIIGDLISDQGNHALFPPKIALITAMMAGVVLECCQENEW